VGCSSGKEDRPEGLKLLEVNGCTACHSIDGTQKIGPTLKGLYGKEIVVITQGTKHTIKADRDYLERSILDPRADVVEGFKPTMPGNFKNQLGDKDLNSILDYLESIGHN
jgi:cytochrome c oxidase subunit 2